MITFILIFIFKVYNFPTENQMSIFHIQKFSTLEILLQNILVISGLRGKRNNFQVSSHNATLEEGEWITKTNPGLTARYSEWTEDQCYTESNTNDSPTTLQIRYSALSQ